MYTAKNQDSLLRTLHKPLCYSTREEKLWTCQGRQLGLALFITADFRLTLESLEKMLHCLAFASALFSLSGILVKEKAGSLTGDTRWNEVPLVCADALGLNGSCWAWAQGGPHMLRCPQACSVAGRGAGPLWLLTILSAHEVSPGFSEPAQPGASTNFPP